MGGRPIPDARLQNDIRRLTAVIQTAILWISGILPILVLVEFWLRDPHEVLWLRHHVVETLTILCLALPGLLIFFWPLVLAGTLLFLWRFYRRHRSPRSVSFYARRALATLARVALAGTQSLFAAFWWWLVGWRPVAGAALGAVLLGSHLVWFGRTEGRRRALSFVMGAVAIIWLWSGFWWEYRMAQPVPQERIYSAAAYDAAVDSSGRTIVLDAPSGRAVILSEGQSREVDRTLGPQRLAISEKDHSVYIANFDARWRGAVTRIAGQDVEEIALPGCSKAIDIAAAPSQRLLIACEFSGTLHVYDPARGLMQRTIRVPRLPYAVAVDNSGKALVASENVTGRVALVDIDAGRLIRSRSLGRVNWDAVHDPVGGLWYVARPISGEVVALDDTLRIVRRIAVGSAPRELTITGGERACLLVTHYFSGRLTVIDLRDGRIEARLRIGEQGLWHQFRGISIAPDGSWLASDTNGVWRLPPR
ncbi:MAG: YncE family protein [Candidatus Lernaella stagnicola]|nr:YncE family protein [Candidatus Lernaella stagnicola]